MKTRSKNGNEETTTLYGNDADGQQAQTPWPRCYMDPTLRVIAKLMFLPFREVFGKYVNASIVTEKVEERQRQQCADDSQVGKQRIQNFDLIEITEISHASDEPTVIAPIGDTTQDGAPTGQYKHKAAGEEEEERRKKAIKDGAHRRMPERQKRKEEEKKEAEDMLRKKMRTRREAWKDEKERAKAAEAVLWEEFSVSAIRSRAAEMRLEKTAGPEGNSEHES